MKTNCFYKQEAFDMNLCQKVHNRRLFVDTVY